MVYFVQKWMGNPNPGMSTNSNMNDNVVESWKSALNTAVGRNQQNRRNVFLLVKILKEGAR